MIAQRHKFAWSGPFNFNKSFQNTFQIAEEQIQPDDCSKTQIRLKRPI